MSLSLASTLVSEEQREPFPGITVHEQRWDDPDNDVFVAEVDLCAAGVQVLATEAPSSRETAGHWAEDVGAQFAINGDFYSSTSVYGDAVGSGERWPLSQLGVDDSGSWYHTSHGFIALGADWADFTHSGWTKESRAPSSGWAPGEVSPTPHADTESLVSGFPQLVYDGEVYTCSSPTASDCFPDRSDMRARHPRSAMGLSEDRTRLVFVVVDGRSSRSSGMYGAELAELMGTFDVWQAFNLDGGGSSTFWLEGEGAVNDPSDGSMRSVANHWGVVASGSGSPAHCLVPGGCFPLPIDGGGHFADMEDDAEVLAILDVVDECEAGYFCPECGVSRADLITWIGRAAGWPDTGPATASFDDVPVDHPAFAYVEEALARGVTNGCGGSSFCPDDIATRAHGAALLSRAWTLPDPETHAYSDVSETWRPGVDALDAVCVVEECAPELFCPDDDLARADAARWIHRLVQPPCPDEGDSSIDEEDSGLPAGLDGAPGPRMPLGGGCGGGLFSAIVVLGLYRRRR